MLYNTHPELRRDRGETARGPGVEGARGLSGVSALPLAHSQMTNIQPFHVLAGEKTGRAFESHSGSTGALLDDDR